jgi:hypothetical protein
MAKDPLETVPGGAGRGPQLIVPKGGEEKVEDAKKSDPAPPTVPGGAGDGPLI